MCVIPPSAFDISSNCDNGDDPCHIPGDNLSLWYDGTCDIPDEHDDDGARSQPGTRIFIVNGSADECLRYTPVLLPAEVIHNFAQPCGTHIASMTNQVLLTLILSQVPL